MPPREIVKRVGNRAYRYAIDRVCDPLTGKSKRRWRYLGPVLAEPAAGTLGASDAGPSVSTRDRLLDGFESLLADTPFTAVTIGAVGRAAGLAHGTFYRYFRDRDAILEAAIGRIRDDVGRSDPALALDGGLGPLGRERERVARWLDALTTIPVRRTALIRAWYLQREAMGDLASLRRARRAEKVDRLSAYFAALDGAGLVRIPDSRSLALGTYAAVDGVLRAAIVEDERLDAQTIAALRTIVMRAVFGEG